MSDDQLLEVQQSHSQVFLLRVLTAEHHVVQPEVSVDHGLQLGGLKDRVCVASSHLLVETRFNGGLNL